MGLQFLKKGVLMGMLLNTLNGYAQTGDDKGSDKSRVLSIFYQVGLSPRNDNFGYFGAGCTYSGFLSSNGTDVLGLALADGMFTDVHDNDETSIELSYN